MSQRTRVIKKILNLTFSLFCLAYFLMKRFIRQYPWRCNNWTDSLLSFPYLFSYLSIHCQHWGRSNCGHHRGHADTKKDKESAIVTDSMTGYHAPRPLSDVHHRRPASEWTHRQTLAQTGCGRTDWTLFWLLQGSAAARKLAPRTDPRRTSFSCFQSND